MNEEKIDKVLKLLARLYAEQVGIENPKIKIKEVKTDANSESK